MLLWIKIIKIKAKFNTGNFPPFQIIFSGKDKHMYINIYYNTLTSKVHEGYVAYT